MTTAHVYRHTYCVSIHMFATGTLGTYVYTHVCIHACTHAIAHAHTRVCTRFCIPISTSVHISVHVCICMHVHMPANVSIPMSEHMPAHMSTNICSEDYRKLQISPVIEVPFPPFGSLVAHQRSISRGQQRGLLWLRLAGRARRRLGHLLAALAKRARLISASRKYNRRCHNPPVVPPSLP